MSIFTKLGVNVAAPFNADGTPRQISPQDFQIWMTEVERLIKGLLGGVGGVELPELIYRYVITGGDENNIIGQPNAMPPTAAGEALFTIEVTRPNTGNVTINGKPLLTSSGNQITIGGLVPGIWLFLDDGENFRLVSDQSSQAIMDAAEQAAQSAQASRDIVENLASDAVSQGNVPIYSTLSAISAIEIPAGITAIRVNGRNIVGDGLGGLYIATDNGSSDTGTSSDGRTWYRALENSNRGDVTGVRVIDVSRMIKGTHVQIENGSYVYDTISLLNDNAVTVLKPIGIDASDPGRWVMQTGSFLPTFELTFGNAGSGADFTDLEEALRFCSKFRPEYAYGRAGNGRCINLRILAGTTVTQGIALARGQDLGHVRLVSDDDIVPVNFPTDVWWAYAEYNSRLPLFSTIFDMQGIGYDGVALKHGSSVCFEYLTALPPFAGIINSARSNVFLNTDCHGAFRKGCFTGAAGNGIHFEKGCHGTAREALVSGCSGTGLYLLSGCTIDAHLIDAKSCNRGMEAILGSRIGAFGADVSYSSSYAIYANSGAEIDAPNAIILNSNSYGAVADGGGKVVVNNATYSLASGSTPPNGNFLSTNGSDMSALNIDLTGIGASSSNFRVLNASIMRCHGSIGTTSVAPNGVTPNGLIIK